MEIKLVHVYYTEFGNSSNGLIYSDTTIKQLKFIVDSLNLKFKVCDLYKTYYSKLVTLHNYLTLPIENYMLTLWSS